ncbi:hypothetical protein BDQ17DRAFT_1342838, partial [Cyathus striatus]
LIELACQNEKLVDLEDVLEHGVSSSFGYVEAKHRPKTWVKGSFGVEELLQCGVGKCVESALKLIFNKILMRNATEDVPTHLWFQYVYPNPNPRGKRIQEHGFEDHPIKLVIGDFYSLSFVGLIFLWAVTRK